MGMAWTIKRTHKKPASGGHRPLMTSQYRQGVSVPVHLCAVRFLNSRLRWQKNQNHLSTSHGSHITTSHKPWTLEAKKCVQNRGDMKLWFKHTQDITINQSTSTAWLISVSKLIEHQRGQSKQLFGFAHRVHAEIYVKSPHFLTLAARPPECRAAYNSPVDPRQIRFPDDSNHDNGSLRDSLQTIQRSKLVPLRDGRN